MSTNSPPSSDDANLMATEAAQAEPSKAKKDDVDNIDHQQTLPPPPEAAAAAAAKSKRQQKREAKQDEKKRGLKPRPKRNRKRPRSELHDSIIDQANQTHVTNIRPIELDGIALSQGQTNWLRTVEPYPYTFSSFAKARWIGRTVLDVYHTEFGSYPKSYYESAINQGRILVSDQQVDSSYEIKGSDVLTHTVHRHEPGVAVYSNQSPFVKIVQADDEEVLVVDKPGTIPIHPCGGYHLQSLMNLLEPIYGKLYTIHRLDRLTSGLVILGKSTQVAQEWGKAIMNRNCQKYYLARVKGKFPLNVVADNNYKLPHLKDRTIYPTNGEWVEGEKELIVVAETSSKGNPNKKKNGRDVSHERKRNAYGFWIAGCNGQTIQDRIPELLLKRVFDSKFDENDWLASSCQQGQDVWTDNTKGVLNGCSNENSKQTWKNQMLWFHTACPTRVAKHKDGICEAGSFETLDDDMYLKGVKPAQTSFGVVRYDSDTDSTVVICKPQTGRTHQIRLHLQHLGHPIANDPNYGGDIWYGNPTGEQLCQLAKSKLHDMNEENKLKIDQTKIRNNAHKTNVANAETTSASSASSTRCISDEPATEQELESTGVTKAFRKKDEDIIQFIRRTCVWCARQQVGGVDRDLLEFLVRSNGIWLHAFKYSFTVSGGSKSVSYQAPSPSWAFVDKEKE